MLPLTASTIHSTSKRTITELPGKQVWDRMRAEPDDSIGTMWAGVVLAMVRPDDCVPTFDKLENAFSSFLCATPPLPALGLNDAHCSTTFY